MGPKIKWGLLSIEKRTIRWDITKARKPVSALSSAECELYRPKRMTAVTTHAINVRRLAAKHALMRRRVTRGSLSRRQKAQKGMTMSAISAKKPTIIHVH